MSTANGEGPRLTVRDFQERKDRGEKLVVVTAYDSLFGKLVDESGVDAVLVGDSLGNLLAGFESTLPVTLDQMVYHARSTRAGVKRALLIVDMPFLTYQVSPQRALLNCGRVMAEGGADRTLRAVGRLALWGAIAQPAYWLLSHNLASGWTSCSAWRPGPACCGICGPPRGVAARPW
jgi:hypothetical protein